MSSLAGDQTTNKNDIFGQRNPNTTAQNNEQIIVKTRSNEI